MNVQDWVSGLFSAIDRQEADAFANILKLSGDRVRDYLIYVDASALYPA